MIKLMKYEFKKRRVFIVGALALMAALELLAIFNLYTRDGEMAPIAIFLNIALILGVFAYTWLSVVVDYYCEFTGKQRLLMMSIPESSYKITGAKALYALVENIVFLAVAVGMAYLSNYLWFLKTDTDILGILISQAGEFLSQTDIGFGRANTRMLLGAGILTVVMQYIFSIVTAVLAITISTTVISGNKLNWLISIVIYWALSFVLKLFMIIPAFVLDGMETTATTSTMFSTFAIIAGGYLVFIVAEYIVANVLVTNKLDV